VKQRRFPRYPGFQSSLSLAANTSFRKRQLLRPTIMQYGKKGADLRGVNNKYKEYSSPNLNHVITIKFNQLISTPALQPNNRECHIISFSNSSDKILWILAAHL
jgi:hypothetical protein